MDPSCNLVFSCSSFSSESLYGCCCFLSDVFHHSSVPISVFQLNGAVIMSCAATCPLCCVHSYRVGVHLSGGQHTKQSYESTHTTKASAAVSALLPHTEATRTLSAPSVAYLLWFWQVSKDTSFGSDSPAFCLECVCSSLLYLPDRRLRSSFERRDSGRCDGRTAPHFYTHRSLRSQVHNVRLCSLKKNPGRKEG